jgi:hypothetical protein
MFMVALKYATVCGIIFNGWIIVDFDGLSVQNGASSRGEGRRTREDRVISYGIRIALERDNSPDRVTLCGMAGVLANTYGANHSAE